MSFAPISIADVVTMVSVMVAVVFGIVSVRQNKKMQRRELTVQMLGNFSLNEILAVSDNRMAMLIKNNTRLDGTTIDDQTDGHVINMLDYYEFLCVSCQQKVLDVETVIYIRGGAMSRAYDVCEQYIKDRRKALAHPDLYASFEHMVCHIIRKRPTMPIHS